MSLYRPEPEEVPPVEVVEKDLYQEAHNLLNEVMEAQRDLATWQNRRKLEKGLRVRVAQTLKGVKRDKYKEYEVEDHTLAVLFALKPMPPMQWAPIPLCGSKLEGGKKPVRKYEKDVISAREKHNAARVETLEINREITEVLNRLMERNYQRRLEKHTVFKAWHGGSRD